MATKAKGRKILPISDHLVVDQKAAEEITEHGVVIPDVAKEKPREGVVLAVGPGRWDSGVLVPMTVQVGDHVVFGSYAGSEVTLDGVTYLVLREDDVQGVIQ